MSIKWRYLIFFVRSSYVSFGSSSVACSLSSSLFSHAMNPRIHQSVMSIEKIVIGKFQKECLSALLSLTL
ncbi:hypothetical protein SISSUDRAFT_1050278 [Sistotremastrum suecicum HHB10207 ss-3]|uniref:Uncharacterized protein n=1 Tax=Sistotremastrum suecicum HHB10207 ss-3 TaxID=1314776 RepID=A0A166BAE8_9AGAM|nr:hypothetical protein SISSUDRAFT_1050278 [Sistotremastrum suecicum HHB10207 ss-3]